MDIKKLIEEAEKGLKGRASGTTKLVTWAPDFEKTESGLVERKDYDSLRKQFEDAVAQHGKALAERKLELEATRIGHGMVEEREEWGLYLYLTVL